VRLVVPVVVAHDIPAFGQGRHITVHVSGADVADLVRDIVDLVVFGHMVVPLDTKGLMRRVKRLVDETDFSIREITDRSGYNTEDHLRRIFKRQFGMTMQECRCQQ